MTIAQLDSSPSRPRAVIGVAFDRVRPRRSIWRQRLVDAEAGFKLFLRSDSALFVHLFLAATIVIGGWLLQLQLVEWLLLIVCMSSVLTTELFHSALKHLVDITAIACSKAESSPATPNDTATSSLDQPCTSDEVHRAVSDLTPLLRIADAGVMTAMAGTMLCVVLLFGAKIVELFG